MQSVFQLFSDLSLVNADVSTPLAWNETSYSFYNAAGELSYECIVLTEGDTTTYTFLDSSSETVGSTSQTIQGDTINLRFFDTDGDLTNRERTITRDDYTQIEYWDENGRTHAVKQIHTDTTTGVQNYDANWNLVSAHLEIDDGNGRKQVADYGLNWAVIHRETVTVSGDVTTTIIEEGGAGNISGGSVVTAKDDFTLIESYGDDWELVGAVKEIHTDTTTGEQVYDADWNLVSAHLETDDGNGRTQTANYGADWTVIYRETITVSGNVTTTVIEEGGVGNISGGSVVTAKDDFTLIESYGEDWELVGAVKEIHTDTTTGEQVYDADWNLISAHLVIEEGNRYVTEKYGADWALISRLRVTTTDEKVVTEYLTGADAELQWQTTIRGDRPDVENKYEVFEAAGNFTGNGAMDVMLGDDGDDVFFGMGGEDVLKGGKGNDYLNGGADADELDGGKGQDTIWGGAGDDQIKAGNDDDMVWGGSGDDWISAGRDDDEVYGGIGDDTLKGDAGNDFLVGGAGNDTLSGGGDDDTLSGGDGDDDLFGNSGDDILQGGTGSDRLYGSNGEDVLYGAGDGDVLNGGEDADVFVFIDDGSWNGTGDMIADFVQGEDVINVADLHVAVISSTFQAGIADQLVISVQGADSVVSYDAEGDGVEDYSFTVRDVTSLGVDDFELYDTTFWA